MIQDTPTGGRWGYEVSSGMSREQAAAVFGAVQPFLRAFNPHARYLANYRDHAVVIYDRRGGQLRPTARQFPRLAYAQAPPTPWAEGSPEERSLKC
jgi:hypothetical protein